MKRRAPMKRGAELARTVLRKRAAKLAPVNRKRRSSAFQRAYGSDARVAFVQALPCLVCGATPSDNAHTATGGMGRKADAETIAPLCRAHHRELHQVGTHTFQAVHRIDLAAAAAATESAWRRRAGEAA